MGLSSLFGKKDAKSGLGVRVSKDYKFLLKRVAVPEGSEVYHLENRAKNEKILIPRELFDRFRSTVKSLYDAWMQSQSPDFDFERTIYFKDQNIFKIRRAAGEEPKVLIQDLSPQKGSTGFLTVPMAAIAELIPIFYDPNLKHTSDLFERLIRYHKLFHFSFNEGSESITSNLSLRRDVLSQIDDYVPAMRSNGAYSGQSSGGEEDDKAPLDVSSLKGKGAKAKENVGAFKPKLGQKEGEKSYAIDYATLFQSSVGPDPDKLPRAADDQSKRGAVEGSKTFPLPIKAQEVKALQKPPFRCELTQEESQSLRENFLQDRNFDLYLGFEMIDAIYKSSGKLKTFRFPLYYLKVSVEESGRQIYIKPHKNAEIYLNHLALATLVESFAAENAAHTDPVEQFFHNLVSQKIEVQGRLSELSIHKQLPVAEEVFDRVRDILLGLPGENGKGGILGPLKTIGIECDTESVALYKASNPASPTVKALEQDIDRIQEEAAEYPERFYRSLLGQFLTPELKDRAAAVDRFCERPLCPGALPKSTRDLLEKLNHHDLVLLEGPPGTGKTFAIMNLLIHSMNTGQRLLVVSDQKASIHALDEKIQAFLLGQDLDSPSARNKLSLYRQAIKMIDMIPDGNPSLTSWMAQLTQSLNLDQNREHAAMADDKELEERIREIDHRMQRVLLAMQDRMDQQMSDQQHAPMIAAKHLHPTTAEDIQDFIAFLDFTGAGRHEKRSNSARSIQKGQTIRDFIKDRQLLAGPALMSCYQDFTLPSDALPHHEEQMHKLAKLVEQLLELKPRDPESLEKILAEYPDSKVLECIEAEWKVAFPADSWIVTRWFKLLGSYIKHPNQDFWLQLRDIINRQIALIQTLNKHAEGGRICRQIQSMHEAMRPDREGHPSLALEAAVFTHMIARDQNDSIQLHLLYLKELQQTRDDAIKDLLLTRMSQVIQKGQTTDAKNVTSAWTTLGNLLEALKDCDSIDHGVGVSLLRELQATLFQCFPVWICRKQAVSFLFPSKDRIFDLVVIDEAGQCRVDDAIPLLYRAKKLMVVGDEKQTVLDKNSVIDDFLFRTFNLEDHLRQTQARGMKGGGSHIFGLVKSIKQAEVMLDEHFRCPPEIIQYSNQFVYDSKLKVMQWHHRHMAPSVVVDYSEKDAKSNEKATSGKFKDIETELVDRYLDFVTATIKRIEKEIGRQINMETEVALCYFLLKNEVYVKDKKSEFLKKLGRGKDVLDGAGAALQGKERNYIFYLWDINRSNIRFFRQGDDPDKRKGELNVLMSRPKIRAYHYLHPEFETLKHETATISDYLWKTYQSQGARKSQMVQEPRRIRPGQEYRPWQRSSGELVRAILKQILSNKKMDRWQAQIEEAEVSVVVGDPRCKVDLMILGPTPRAKSIAIVDLSAFEGEKQSASVVLDYYFQLQRATPPIEPVFLFLHELADERSDSFQSLVNFMDDLLASKE